MSTKSVTQRYAADNLDAATIILQDIGRYGAESLMVQWARAVVEKQNEFRLTEGRAA